MRPLAAWLLALFRRRRLDDELSDEISAHLEFATADNVARGMSPEEARVAAARRFGGTLQAREAYRDGQGFAPLDAMSQDLRYALRALYHTPGFTSVAVLTLVLGIGMTAALFSVVDGVMFRPLPYNNSNRLMVLWTDDRLRQIHEALVSYPTYEDWHRESRAFAELAICTRNSPVTLTNNGDVAERLDGAATSASFFSVLGVAPLLGRTFSAAEQQQAAPVVVVSYGLWQRRFGAATTVLGGTLEIDGQSNTVIGVMPETFQFPSASTELWRPMRPNAARDRPIGLGIGRLKPASTAPKAQTEMDFLADRLTGQYPELANNPDFSGFRVKVVPFDQQVVNTSVRTSLWVLFGAVVFVMLIGCANVANLLLARGCARRQEFALRVALGASRARIFAQLLTESVILGVIGGILGGTLATFTVRALVAIAPASLPRLESITLDRRMLAFTVALSVLNGLVFGLIPAWRVSHADPNEALKAGGRGPASGWRGMWTQKALVAGQFALAMLLLCGAGLLIRSFSRLQDAPLGFRPKNVLVFRFVLPNGITDQQKAEFYVEAIERLRGLPGVISAGAISNLFLASNPDATIVAEGRPETASAGAQVMDDAISPDGFATLGVSLRRGRFFTNEDDRHALPVAVVNETLSQRYWPNSDPVGKRFRFGDGRFNAGWVTIVGVAADMRRSGLEQEPLAQVFLPMAQLPSRGTDLMIRTATEPLALISLVRRELAPMNRSVPIYRISTLDQRLATSVESRRFQMLLLGFFAATALILAAIGIYGVMHYVVTQRTGEMGLRLALGATRRNVLVLVFREAARVVLVGAAAGVCAAWALTRAMGSLLYGVAPSDPETFLGAALLLGGFATVACLRPAWRAASMDPNAVLHGP